ncbi:hypothetical protein AMJ47_00520 [Parcubacteria bacterium DG_72]|nr:MAG: hypothetical protein AMJ47_00520 [Parcubacteria bacterium DG_72]
MTEKQLVCQLKKLQDIQPRKDWVVFTKSKIFEENNIGKEKSIVSLLSTIIKELQMGEKFVFQHKMAFASALIIVVLFGLFGFAQKSVPGDSLFALKKMTEQSQAVFISDNYKSIHNFEIAGKRLDDLTKIAQENDVKKIAPALVEYNETVSRAAETLNQAGSVQEIALEIKKLQEKENLVRSFGIEIAENKDLDNAIAEIVKREVAYLKEKELTEEQKLILADIEKEIEQEDYSSALEKVLLMEKY